MTIVSISKTAKITGKACSTIQAYIRQGKLSKATDPVSNADGVDASELIRVFGELKGAGNTPASSVVISHDTTPYNTSKKDIEIIKLAAEVEKLQAVLKVKEEHIESINKAMLLLEHKVHTEAQNPKKSFWKIFGN